MGERSPDLPGLPEAFGELLAAALPAGELACALESFGLEKPTAFRANTLLATADEVSAELAQAGLHPTPVGWLAEAFTVLPAERRALTETAAFYAGRIYIQNLASMTAPPALDPQAGESVLDLAAAPGGKTLHLAALMQGKGPPAATPPTGRLVAVEAIKGRFFRLRANLEQHGATFVETFLMDGRAAGRRWPGVFDRVLLDAPCSSEARFSRLAPESWAHWSARKVKETAHKQRGLLAAAFAALRPGGVLLYCTCSFSPEENEGAVDWLLRRVGDEAEVLPLEPPPVRVQPGLTAWGKRTYHPDLAGSVRILPDALMDGFFLCKLGKR